MAFASSSVFKDHERWLRIATLLDFGGRELCLTVLHKYEGLPTDGAMLYRELEPAKHKIARFKHQMEILCPPTGITDVNKFDLTLLTSIIAQKFPGKYDQVVSDIRNARNREYHRGNKRLDDIEFINLWNDTAHMLERHGFDLQLIGDLKTCDLSIDNKFKDVAMHIFVEGKVKIYI